MVLSIRDQIKRIANEIHKSKVRSMFVLGKGLAEAVAKEGALKVWKNPGLLTTFFLDKRNLIHTC